MFFHSYDFPFSTFPAAPPIPYTLYLFTFPFFLTWISSQTLRPNHPRVGFS